MQFVDRVRVFVRAGHGGDGAVAWRREKYVPRGGPAGGDGGRGGNVVLVADQHLSTLLDLRYRQHLAAEDGERGGSHDRNGRAGADLRVRVPVGTVVYEEVGDEPGPAHGEEPASKPPKTMQNVWVVDEAEGWPEEDDVDGSDQASEVIERGPGVQLDVSAPDVPLHPQGPLLRVLGDLTHADQELVVARGGRGGRGNIHFRSSTNRAPDRAEPGEAGESLSLRLELKLLADVGIIGYPNVGKSTLIAAISRARPKIADYPFTTLVPQLGVVFLGEERSMVVADVPGLIQGASEGRGLGHQFLRHLERTRVLLHLLAPDPDPARSLEHDLDTLELELARYGPVFDGRPRVVALNKMDLLATPDGRRLVGRVRRALRERGIPLFPISATTGEGVPELLEALWRRLQLSGARQTRNGSF